MDLLRRLILLCLFLATLGGITAAVKAMTRVELPTSKRPVVFYSSQTGQDLRDHYLAAVNQAEHSITLIIFTMRDRKIIQALNMKAQKGVDVTVIYDAKGADNLDRQLSDDIKKVKRNPQGITHQKILIVDRKMVLIGTSNMTTSSLKYYVNLVNGFWSPELGEWLSTKLDILKSFNEGPGGLSRLTLGRQELELWFLPTGQRAPERIIELIRSAQSSLRIAMFTWTRLDFAEEVIQAHKRGVDVKVMIDKQSGYGASVRVIETLKAAGVPLYFNLGKGLMHAKTMTIDNKILVNGSANWTKSAFTRNDDCFWVLWLLTPEQQRFMNHFWNLVFSHTEASHDLSLSSEFSLHDTQLRFCTAH